MESVTKPRLFKIQDVCSVLNMSRSMVYRLTTSGELHAVRIGKSVRITEEAIETYLRSLTASSSEVA